MSVRPIDLQTLFSHLNQVGREQAHMRNAAALQQTQQGMNLVKHAEENDHQINETDKTEEGLEDVKEEGEGNASFAESGDRKETEDKEERKKDYFRDPDLGHNLDITG
ncbi:MAG: hypothetical protein JEY99_12430 [Spirochaetales bacterium]|nr:hypothetical protein [Spirochaetales bacterium]